MLPHLLSSSQLSTPLIKGMVDMNESELATTWASGSLLPTVVHSDGILFLFCYVSFHMNLFLVANSM